MSIRSTVAGRGFPGRAVVRRRGTVLRTAPRLGRRTRTRPGTLLAGPLSAREQEVAALVAAGRLSRDIASALSLSEKTVSRPGPPLAARVAAAA